MPDDGRCYVEDEALAMVGHFWGRQAELGRGHFSTELACPRGDSAKVTFDIPEADFVELRRVVKIMLPHVLVVGDGADVVRRRKRRE